MLKQLRSARVAIQSLSGYGFIPDMWIYYVLHVIRSEFCASKTVNKNMFEIVKPTGFAGFSFGPDFPLAG